MLDESIKNLIDAMKDRNLKEMARLSGLPYMKLWRFRNGDLSNPDIRFFNALDQYINDKGRIHERMG